MAPTSLFKECINCGNRFEKRSTLSMREWTESTRYCSRSCAKLGKPSWNKGKVGVFSGDRNPNWKGELLLKVCKQCNKQFRTAQPRIYCSTNCFAENQRGKPIKHWQNRIPWNKGKKTGIVTSGAFPKGHKPENKTRFLPGEDNPMWKGDSVGYFGLHEWVGRRLGKPKYCDHCNRMDQPKYEWANKSHQYLRDVSDWIRLCSSCHYKYDSSFKES